MSDCSFPTPSAPDQRELALRGDPERAAAARRALAPQGRLEDVEKVVRHSGRHIAYWSDLLGHWIIVAQVPCDACDLP